jgi:hypothetical protein
MRCGYYGELHPVSPGAAQEAAARAAPQSTICPLARAVGAGADRRFDEPHVRVGVEPDTVRIILLVLGPSAASPSSMKSSSPS